MNPLSNTRGTGTPPWPPCIDLQPRFRRFQIFEPDLSSGAESNLFQDCRGSI